MNREVELYDIAKSERHVIWLSTEVGCELSLVVEDGKGIGRDYVFVTILDNFLVRVLRPVQRTPIAVPSRNRDVKDPLMPFFFRFNQAFIAQRHQVLLHPLDLRSAHPPALKVDGDARQMGRSRVTLEGRCVAVVPAKLLLHLHRAHRGIYLNLAVKLFVIILAEIVKKFLGPGPAIAAIRIEPRIEAQRLILFDGNQIFAGDQLLQFRVILDSRQVHPVNLGVLAKQGIVRRTEYRVPSHSAEAVMLADVMGVLRRNILAQRKRRGTHPQGDAQHPRNPMCTDSHEVDLALYRPI